VKPDPSEQLDWRLNAELWERGENCDSSYGSPLWRVLVGYAYSEAGRQATDRGDGASSEDSFAKARMILSELGPLGDSGLSQWAGAVLRDLGRPGEALPHYLRAVDLAATERLGSAELKELHLDVAATYLLFEGDCDAEWAKWSEKALRVFPEAKEEDADVWFALALYYSLAGINADPNLAVAMLDEAERTGLNEGKLYEARQLRAHVLLLLGRWGESAKLWNRLRDEYESVSNGNPLNILARCMGTRLGAQSPMVMPPRG
jgi:tetratricopeptide (TPR) repeat protein